MDRNNDDKQPTSGGPGDTGRPEGDGPGGSPDGLDGPVDDADWSRIYWITGLLGLAYVILLGLFTLIFNTPAS